MFRFGDPGGRLYGVLGAANANALALWTSYSSATATASVSAGNGRTTGSCLRFAGTGTANSCVMSKTLDAQPTWGLAWAWKTTALPSNTVRIASFFDGASQQLELRLASDGTLTVTRNGSAIAGASSGSGAVPPNAWTHLEWKVTIHPSAGVLQLWVNGVSKISLSGQNTRASSNSSANSFNLGMFDSPGTTMTQDFDDIVLYDGQATDANGYTDITGPIGDCGLVCLFPTGAGTMTQFTPDSGSNYARVNEATPDGDTSYVESSTVSNIDTYALADLPAVAVAVKSIAQVFYARKTDVGSRGMKGVLRSGGGQTVHATEIALGNSYAYAWQTWGQDPNNGSPTNWTVAAVNALEAGQEVSS